MKPNVWFCHTAATADFGLSWTSACFWTHLLLLQYELERRGEAPTLFPRRKTRRAFFSFQPLSLKCFLFYELLRASCAHHQMRHQHLSPFWGHDLSTFRASLQTVARTWRERRGGRLLTVMGSRCRAARLQSRSGSTLVRARSRCGECKHWMYKRARVCAHGRERA